MATADTIGDKHLEAALEIIAGGPNANLDEIYARHEIRDQAGRWAAIARLPAAAVMAVRKQTIETDRLNT